MSDSEGDELLLDEPSDYQAIPALDRYEGDMLDDRPAKQSSSRRELSARREAEEAMAARDEQQKRGAGGGAGGSTRGPRALEQVKANRASNVELERLGAALKCSEATMAKAENFLKKAYTGTRCLSHGTQVKHLPAACLEIASRVCKKPVNRDSLLRRAGVDEHGLSHYTRALSHCYCLLGVRREVSVIDLCAEFKCNAIKTSVRQTLEAYKRQFWASLNEDRRQDADFSRPVFAVVALFITAEKNKHVVKPLQRNELLKASDVQEGEFSRIYHHMKLLASQEAKASAEASAAAAAAAAAAAKQQEAAQREAERQKQAPVFGGSKDAQQQSVAASAPAEKSEPAALDGSSVVCEDGGSGAPGATGGDASSKQDTADEARPRKVDEGGIGMDLATPARCGLEALPGGRADAKSAISTVKKADARRPVSSAAQRLSNLCSIGVKRKAPLQAPPAVPKEGQGASQGALGEKGAQVTAAESCLVVAGDGKAHTGSKKKQRKEEADAEKARQKEARAREYATWREAQIAEFQQSKEKFAPVGASAAAETLQCRPGGEKMQEAHAEGQDAAETGTLKEGSKGTQASLLAFIRPVAEGSALRCVAGGSASAAGGGQAVGVQAVTQETGTPALRNAMREVLARAAEAREHANPDA